MAFQSNPVASTPLSEHEWDPYGPAIFIHVGNPGTFVTWKVTQSLLCTYSTWFRRTCDTRNEGYVEPEPGEPHEIRLPGEDPAVFSMVLYYMTHRRFFDWTIEPGAVLAFDKIIDIYAFGEKRGMPLIQNAATDLFARKVRYCVELPDRWATEYLWEKTQPGSKLRKMLVEFVRAIAYPSRHRSMIWNTLIHGISDNPDRLVMAAQQMMLEGRSIRVSHKTWNRMQACEWHVHEPGVRCEMAEEAQLDRGRGEDDAEIGLERGGRGAHRGIARAQDSPSYYFG